MEYISNTKRDNMIEHIILAAGALTWLIYYSNFEYKCEHYRAIG